MKTEGKTFVKLHLYKNQPVGMANKENLEAAEENQGFEDKSPSKMTDQEKLQYRNKLFEEGD